MSKKAPAVVVPFKTWRDLERPRPEIPEDENEASDFIAEQVTPELQAQTPASAKMRARRLVRRLGDACALPEDREPTMRELIETGQKLGVKDKNNLRPAWDYVQAEREKNREEKEKHDKRERLNRLDRELEKLDIIKEWVSITADTGYSELELILNVAGVTQLTSGAVYDVASIAVDDFMGAHGHEPVEMVFDHKDATGIAKHVHAELFSSIELTADGPMSFFINDRTVKRHLIDAMIDSVLARCRFVKYVGDRDEDVYVDSILVDQVRKALARAHPRLPGETTTIKTISATPVLELAAPDSSLEADFIRDAVEFVPFENGWTFNSDIVAAFDSRRRRAGLPPLPEGERDTFIARFKNIAGARVRGGRRRRHGKMARGYSGVRLRP